MNNLRHFLYDHFYRRGHAPGVDAMADAMGESRDAVLAELQRLASEHAIVLTPRGDAIDVAHPFATLPTPFLVENRHGRWWGNCAWDSLAIASLSLHDPTTITTTSGADGGEPIVLTVEGDAVSDPSLVVHYAVPASRWWDDVRYTCATILLFRSADELPAWCARHGIARGEVVPVSTVWQLARAWYSDKLDPDWKRKSIAEAQAILDGLGLRGDFWDLSRGWS